MPIPETLMIVTFFGLIQAIVLFVLTKLDLPSEAATIGQSVAIYSGAVAIAIVIFAAYVFMAKLVRSQH